MAMMKIKLHYESTASLKLYKSWQQILSFAFQYEIINMGGNAVCLYKDKLLINISYAYMSYVGCFAADKLQGNYFSCV